MKKNNIKLSILFVGLVSGLLYAPVALAATKTYTCSVSSLPPLTVNDPPTDAEALSVSEYIKKCETAGGNVKKPAEPTTPASPTSPTASQPASPGNNLLYTPLEPIPGITTGANGDAINFPNLLGNIYKIAIIIGGLFSVLMLTLSGIRYMLSDVVTDKAKAIKRIRACLWGLLLIAISWLILNTINPQLLNFKLNPCPEGSVGCTISAASPSPAGGTQKACGSSYPSGCATGYYCGKQNGESTCLANTNKTAEQKCAASGGEWWNYNDDMYCWYKQYTTLKSCKDAGYDWAFLNYCYKYY